MRNIAWIRDRKEGRRQAPTGHGFKNLGVLIPEKATGVIGGIPVPGGAKALSGARNASADPRGSRNGLDSSQHLGRGPPERRRRSEIPDLMAINSSGKLPQSGATDLPGNSPGNSAAATGFRGFLPF